MNTTPTVAFATLASGDNALFVNEQLCATADPSCGDDDLGRIATNLARILNVTMRVIALDAPSRECWTWSDVVATLPPTAPTPDGAAS